MVRLFVLGGSMDQYESEDDVLKVVRGFENCTIAADDFSHCKHIAVAAYYVETAGMKRALEEMRSGLIRFLIHYGVDLEKYNETITLFWLKLVEKFLAQLSHELSLAQRITATVNHFSNSKLVLEYFSEKRLHSGEAKKNWIEPDLRKL
jgi:hypothetical protein